jgi:hypothetical protein
MLPSSSFDQLCSLLVAFFGGGFSPCLFTGISTLGVYFFALPPFSGAGSVFCQAPLLSVCYDGSLFVFQFCGEVWLWVLFTGPGNELCDPLIHYLPCFGEWLITLPLLYFLPFQCLLIVHIEISTILLPLSLVHFQCSRSLCCYARLQFSVCYLVFWGWGQSAQGLCWFFWGEGWLHEFHIMHDAHLFGLSNVSQAGLEPVAAAAVVVAALKFSFCNSMTRFNSNSN